MQKSLLITKRWVLIEAQGKKLLQEVVSLLSKWNVSLYRNSNVQGTFDWLASEKIMPRFLMRLVFSGPISVKKRRTWVQPSSFHSRSVQISESALLIRRTSCSCRKALASELCFVPQLHGYRGRSAPSQTYQSSSQIWQSCSQSRIGFHHRRTHGLLCRQACWHGGKRLSGKTRCGPWSRWALVFWTQERRSDLNW